MNEEETLEKEIGLIDGIIERVYKIMTQLKDIRNKKDEQLRRIRMKIGVTKWKT